MAISTNSDTTTTSPSGKHGRFKWLRIVLWGILSLVVLAGVAIWIFLAYMSPQHIKELIEKESGKYLRAEIRIGNLDYKLFSSYPWLEFEVDSVAVISKSLDNIPISLRDSLPSNADFLASVAQIKGKINIKKLLHKEIKIKGLSIVHPEINIVMVNDTTANFLIIEKMPKIKKKPKIDFNEVSVETPLSLNFFSLPYNLDAGINVENLAINQEKHNLYHFIVNCIIKGKFQQFELPQSIPVGVSSEIEINNKDFNLTLNALSLAFAGIACETKGKIKAGLNNVDIEELEIGINIKDLFSSIDFLPMEYREKITLPPYLSGNLPLEIKAVLSAPYSMAYNEFKNLSINQLPPLYASLKVNDADLVYAPPGTKLIQADDIYLDSHLAYDPQNPEHTSIEINELRVQGEGIELSGTLQVDNLLGDLQNIDLNVNFQSPLMETLSYLLPNLGMKLSGHLSGSVGLKADAFNLGRDGLKNIKILGDLKSKALNIGEKQNGIARIFNFGSNFYAALPSYPLSDYDGTKLDFEFKSDSISADFSQDKINLKALTLKIDATDTIQGAPNPFGDILLKVNSFQFTSNSSDFHSDGLVVTLNGTLNSNPQSNYVTIAASSGGNDSIIAARVNHTPLLLEYDGESFLQTILNMVSVNATVSLNKGSFKSDSYLLPMRFKGLNLTTNLNDFQWNVRKMELGNSSLSMNGKFTGLQPFMTSTEATPLSLEANVDFGSVDINQLSYGYYGPLIVSGNDSVFSLPPVKPYSKSDSVCVAIPRNIDAKIKLRADSAFYMGYGFSPLSTEILVNHGDATLKNLTIGAPYCTAVVDWTYSTALLNDIYMDLKAKILDFNFLRFYSVFPQITDKAYELHNFSGNINADISCYFKMFPDMFLDEPSLKGKFDIKGTGLEFKRQGKIERITHLMLIEGNEPIKIQNIDITGGFHDNLLQINPFKIAFDEYQLKFGGVNNTKGDIYYHLALEKSPFHMPFGVSVIGNFKHPEIRFGGIHMDESRAEMIATELDSDINLNIMAWLRHGWMLFIQEAAKYEMDKSNK